ncbi:Choline/ethanolaminephosphotransferase 1 [Bienertia sinuspersici]
MQLDSPLSVVVMSSYFTNTLILPVINGPTEGLMLIYLCHFFTSFVGKLLQHFKDPGVPSGLYLMIAFAVLPTVAFKDYLSPSDIFGNYPHLVVMGTGLAFGFLVSLLYLPLAIANALTAKLNDGVPLIDELLVLVGYCALLVFCTCTWQHQSSMKLQLHWEYTASGLLGKKHKECSSSVAFVNPWRSFLFEMYWINFVHVDCMMAGFFYNYFYIIVRC